MTGRFADFMAFDRQIKLHEFFAEQFAQTRIGFQSGQCLGRPGRQILHPFQTISDALVGAGGSIWLRMPSMPAAMNARHHQIGIRCTAGNAVFEMCAFAF